MPARYGRVGGEEGVTGSGDGRAGAASSTGSVLLMPEFPAVRLTWGREQAL